jgi:hypothetical protein
VFDIQTGSPLMHDLHASLSNLDIFVDAKDLKRLAPRVALAGEMIASELVLF